jgi:hypothetical protein
MLKLIFIKKYTIKHFNFPIETINFILQTTILNLISFFFFNINISNHFFFNISLYKVFNILMRLLIYYIRNIYIFP